jgi:hypothetical protein
METPLSVIDHLVFISPDLEEGIDIIERLLGVRAAPGGRHEAWKTRNAVLNLGPRCYLEIMARDESRRDGRLPRPFGLDSLKQPKLLTWAARSDGLHRIVETARRRGVDLGEVRSGSRQRPDGTLLQWSMTDLGAGREGGAIPFFIDWGASPHPAEGAPRGCRLEKLRIFHPEAIRVSVLLKELGAPLTAEDGPVGIEATIETSSGAVILK